MAACSSSSSGTASGTGASATSGGTNGRLQWRRLRAFVGRLIEKFDVRPRNPAAKLSQLSGGNQQRAMLAKWLEIQPKLLSLHEPVPAAAKAGVSEALLQGPSLPGLPG